MYHSRNAAWLAGCLCISLAAGAAAKNNAIRITIVDSQTRSVALDDSGVPKNCDGVNYDAYCLSSKTAEITNLLLVQEADRAPFWVTCTINTKWSRCMPLAKGESFDARQEKRGLSIYFLDDNGKVRQQLYTYVAADAKGQSRAVTAAQVQTSQVQTGQGRSTQTQPSAVQSSPVQSTVQSSPAQASTPTVTPGESVKCSFASTPGGAEITVDGEYVGSTPSVLSLSVGTHEIGVSLPGFVQWVRQLTVSPRSDLTVNAILEKVQ